MCKILGALLQFSMKIRRSKCNSRTVLWNDNIYGYNACYAISAVEEIECA